MKVTLMSLLSLAFVAPLSAGIRSGSQNLGAIWCIGDSITQSNCDQDPHGSPRKSLHDLLKAGGFTFTFTGHYTANPEGLPVTGDTPETNLYQYHSGISGSVIGDGVGGRTGMTQSMGKFWTSGRLATVKPEVILIMLGANDTCSDIEAPGAPARLAKLLETVRALPGIGKPTILVSNVTPIRTDEKAIANVALLNAEIPRIVREAAAQGSDVHFVDQFTPMNAAYEKTMCKDHLHPNAAGNESIARHWFAKIKELAEKR